MINIFPISSIDRITTNNLHLTFLRSADLIANHLHIHGYIHAEARSMPLCRVSHDLTDNKSWGDVIAANKAMLQGDPIQFLLNAVRNYVEIPDYQYSPKFFEVSLIELVATLNIALTRYTSICDAPEPFMRIFSPSKYSLDKRRVLAVRQERYFSLQAEKAENDDSDNPDFDDLCAYEDFDWTIPAVERGVQCGSYETCDDVVPIEEQVCIVCDEIFDQNLLKDVEQSVPDAVSQFTVKVTECVVNPQRNYVDVKNVQIIRDAVFSLPAQKIAMYTDYLLSTPANTHGVMCNTLPWTLTRPYCFFFACKGSGKSTVLPQLQQRRIGVFEDEYLMKLVPYYARIHKDGLSEWRENIADNFIMLVLMAIARGDHVVWSLSNFAWYANRFPWLRGITGLVLCVRTVHQHPNQSPLELHDKRKRDEALIDTMLDSGYPVRYAHTLACALNADDNRSHISWMQGSANDIKYIERNSDG